VVSRPPYPYEVSIGDLLRARGSNRRVNASELSGGSDRFKPQLLSNIEERSKPPTAKRRCN